MGLLLPGWLMSHTFTQPCSTQQSLTGVCYPSIPPHRHHYLTQCNYIHCSIVHQPPPPPPIRPIMVQKHAATTCTHQSSTPHPTPSLQIQQHTTHLHWMVLQRHGPSFHWHIQIKDVSTPRHNTSFHLCTPPKGTCTHPKGISVPTQRHNPLFHWGTHPKAQPIFPPLYPPTGTCVPTQRQNPWFRWCTHPKAQPTFPLCTHPQKKSTFQLCTHPKAKSTFRLCTHPKAKPIFLFMYLPQGTCIPTQRHNPPFRWSTHPMTPPSIPPVYPSQRPNPPFHPCRRGVLGYWWWPHTPLPRGSGCWSDAHVAGFLVQWAHQEGKVPAASVHRHSHGMNRPCQTPEHR